MGISIDTDGMPLLIQRHYHPHLNGMSMFHLLFAFWPSLGLPCSEDGSLCHPLSTPLESSHSQSDNPWAPFTGQVKFETAELLFENARMSQANLNRLFDLWMVTLKPHSAKPLFASHQDLYLKINAITANDVPWSTFATQYTGPQPNSDVPPWVTDTHTVFFHEPLELVKAIIANPDYATNFDFALYHEFAGEKCHWTTFMSSNWAWDQAVCTRILLSVFVNLSHA